MAGHAVPSAETVIVILGCPAAPDGTPLPPLLRRLEAGLLLARQEPSALVIVTGDAVLTPVREAEVMAKWLVAHGLEPSRVLVEPNARMTLENARNVVPLLEAARARRVRLVTDRFHVLRARTLLVAELSAAALGHVRVEACPVPDGLTGWQRPPRLLIELYALARDRLAQRRAPSRSNS